MGLFACCREIYRSHVHCGLVGPTKEAAINHFTKKLRAELILEIESEDAKKIEAKKVLEDGLKTKSEQILAVEESKEAHFGKLLHQINEINLILQRKLKANLKNLRNAAKPSLTH